MTTNDLDQAREWAAEITESRQTNIRPAAFAVARVIQSLPDEWIDADNLREALAWRDSKPSGDDYDGEFYDRLRNLLTPDLPDPLFLAKATHPYFGEGIVISKFPDEDETVRFLFQDDRKWGGTDYRWVYLSALTFHAPETSNYPEFLETEEDYRNAPEGTIVAMSAEAWTKTTENEWSDPTGRVDDKYMSSGVRRRVLRWKWEA